MISFAEQLMVLVPVLIMAVGLAVVLPKRIKTNSDGMRRPRMTSKGVIVDA
jgi:hypothetical protein